MECNHLKNRKTKTLNASSAMENSPKINEEKFGFISSAVLCGLTLTVQEQRKKIISMTFENRLEAEITRHIILKIWFL